MILDVEVLEAGDISFFRKVNCEDDVNDNYDFLAFYIDEVEQARWDSILDWEEVSFAVGSGYHRFKWMYTKNASVSTDLDAAFVDYISFPSCQDINPHLTYYPEELDKTMRPDEQDTDTLLISNLAEGNIEFTISIASGKDNKSGGNRSIEGSYLDCDQTDFQSGEAFTWSFTLFNGSTDSEWLQNLSIQIPQGIEVQSATNFTGGSGGDLYFNGSFGNGALLNWYGEDASGWGVVQGGEYAYGEFSGMVESSFADDAVLDYVITGDIYGSEPHIVEGEITLTNLGSVITWISCDVYEGSVAGQDQLELMVTYTTDGLEDGHYYCSLIIRDNFQHETVIPVHLLVDTYLSSEENLASTMQLDIFPNPFSDETNIMLRIPTPEMISIRITDLQGRTIAKIADGIDLPAGKHNFKWNSSEGNANGNGMYFVIVEYGTERLVHKIIRHE